MIRSVTESDASAVAAIYAHHVRHGTATFDTVAPDADETRDKIVRICAAGAPFLVAEEQGRVIGYAYATRFRDRPAYAYACEDSIYLDPDHIGRGVGAALLGALIAAATDCGFRQMLAVIGGGEPASVALHARAGFVAAGRMRSVGRKHGRWLDTVYMQLALGEGDETPP
jgi:phosphinothricin acetyltransferase